MFFKNRNKKIITIFLIVVLFVPVLSLSYPNKTEAIPVEDSGNWFWGSSNWVQSSLSAASGAITSASQKSLFMKEYVYDPLAWALKEVIIKSMVASTVQWINSGFEGNPAFITDTNGYFSNLTDGIIGDAIFGSKLKFLCSSFSLDVKLALTQQFTKQYQPKCRLSDITKNINGAIDDLGRQWNWNTWYSLTQNSSNNAYGSYIDYSVQVNDNINLGTKLAKEELSWGKGFLSYKKCKEIPVSGSSLTKIVCQTITPGQTIAKSLNSIIQIGNKELITADEMDEIVGALLGQLSNKVLGPEGLLSSSQGSNGQTSYLSQLKQEQISLANLINKMISNLNDHLKNENDYLNIKQISLNTVNKTKNKLDTLKQCYSNKKNIAANNPPSYLVWNNQNVSLSTTTVSLKIQETQNKIDSKLTPLLNNLTNDVNSASLNIDLLKSYKTKTQNSKTAQGLSTVSQSLIDLQSNNNLHSLKDISDAKVERDGLTATTPGIIGQMDKINQETVKEINDCEGFVFKIEPNF